MEFVFVIELVFLLRPGPAFAVGNVKLLSLVDMAGRCRAVFLDAPCSACKLLTDADLRNSFDVERSHRAAWIPSGVIL